MRNRYTTDNNPSTLATWLLVIHLAISHFAAGEESQKHQSSLFPRLEKETPCLLEFSDFSRRKVMHQDDDPVVWLDEKVDELKKSGFEIVFETREQDEVNLRGSLSRPLVSAESVVITLHCGSNVDGGKQANLLWAELVGQIFLLERDALFQGNVLALKEHKISKEAFVRRISSIYRDVACDIKAFHETCWKPWSLKRGCMPVLSVPWFVHAETEDLDAWNAQQQQDGGLDNWRSWADRILAKDAKQEMGSGKSN